MRQAFIEFQKQFAYNPIIKNKKKYKPAKKYIILGMGGSHLAADVIKSINPSIEMLIHSDYGLPALADKELKNYLIIASSYSGNTEEVIDGLKIAYQKKLNIIILATGGKLIKFATANNLPYIQLPDFGIQPRSALGFSCRALLKAMVQNKLYAETNILTKILKGKNYEVPGKKLAKELKNKIPIIYASSNNFSLAYNWKIKFNETGKIPAFYNVFPELNHNEMTGFDVAKQTKDLSKNFVFIFIRDDKDHKQVKKRMDVVSSLYKKRKLPIINIKLAGKNKWLQIFSNLLLADWASYYTSQGYGLESEKVPMVEDFKKLL
ncbi:MAG: SIS domain-containing protein [Patescibacteria group bacterium]|jgi:glucose/mannose-6-phosphate isomerase